MFPCDAFFQSRRQLWNQEKPGYREICNTSLTILITITRYCTMAQRKISMKSNKNFFLMLNVMQVNIKVFTAKPQTNWDGILKEI